MSGQDSVVTAGQARTVIERLRGEEAFMKAFLDGTHRNHGDAVEAMTALHALANGEPVSLAKAEPDDDNAFDDLTPAEAKAAIAEARGDEAFMKAFMDKAHPDHADAVAALTDLQSMASGAVETRAADAGADGKGKGDDGKGSKGAGEGAEGDDSKGGNGAGAGDDGGDGKGGGAGDDGSGGDA